MVGTSLIFLLNPFLPPVHDMGYQNLTMLWAKRNEAEAPESEESESEESPSPSDENANLQTNSNANNED